MKNFKLISCLLFFLFTAQLNAQNFTCSEDLSKLMLDAATIGSSVLWNKTIESAKHNYEVSELDSDLQYLCYAYYGAIGNCLANYDKEKAEKLIEQGIEACEKLAKIEGYESMGNAISGGIKGMAIAFSPMKGMTLGPESDRLIQTAMDYDGVNAFAWMQRASSQYNTPRLFGGDVKESIKSFQKSIEYFDEDNTEHLWLKIEAMVWLGQAYYNLENYSDAKKTYEQVLELVPGYKWVEADLLPKTIKKIEE